MQLLDLKVNLPSFSLVFFQWLFEIEGWLLADVVLFHAF